MISQLSHEKQEISDLTFTEILACSAGFSLDRVEKELHRVTDPWRKMVLTLPKRNQNLTKIVFDTGPNSNQKLLLGDSDDILAVFDCDKESLCRWFFRPKPKEVSCRLEFYILSQLDVGQDISETRFRRNCTDFQYQFGVLMAIVREYAATMFRRALPDVVQVE